MPTPDKIDRPTSGGAYRRAPGGKLTPVQQPKPTPAGGGPRNAKGEPIDSRHRVLDERTGLPVEDAEPKAKAAKTSDKKGGE